MYIIEMNNKGPNLLCLNPQTKEMLTQSSIEQELQRM